MVRSIQVLRGLAAIAVVAIHMELLEAKNLSSHVLPGIFSIGDAGVDLFFVISGFIMIFIQPAPLNGNTHLKFLVNRWTRIFPPYWLAMLPLIPLWLKWPHLFNNYYHNHVDLLRSVLLLPQDYQPLLGVGWSLIHEVYFYVVVSFALYLTPFGRWIFGGIWFVVVFVVFCQFGATNFEGHRELQIIFSPFSLTFLLGYFLGLLWKWIQRFKPAVGLCILALGIGGLLVSRGQLPSLGVYPDNNHLFRFIAFGIPCGLIVLSALILETHLPPFVARLQYFGDRSYALYLLHPLIVTAFYVGLGRGLYAHMGWTGQLSSVSLAIICFFSCLISAAIFHEKVELKSTRWLRRRLERIFSRSAE
jgi:peptidoglycan/LPS O-acetylase OafA/YrhL